MTSYAAFVPVRKEDISDQVYRKHWNAFLYVKQQNSGCMSEKEVGTKITKCEDVTRRLTAYAQLLSIKAAKRNTYIHRAPSWIMYFSVCQHMGQIQKKKKYYNKVRYATAEQTNPPTRNFRKLKRLSERDLELSYSLALCVSFS